ncbi:MAG: uroporphyrinogen-III synthase [Burkholderiales bacterium]
MKRKPLAGKGIVVTRPAHQAQVLTRLISGAGGKPLPFPVIEIRDIENPAPLLALIDRLDEFSVAIFVSPNAVERGMTLVKARRAWPTKLKAAAVGSGGVKTLQHHGVTDVIAPEGRFDSEALLELPDFALVYGKRFVVFRGVGGRELISETLTERGAVVEYAECYRRLRPDNDVAPLLRAWERNELDAIAVTSSEGLRNFLDMIGAAGRELALRTPVFVPHPRIAETASDLGVRRVIVTGPGDDGLLTGLSTYFNKA